MTSQLRAGLVSFSLVLAGMAGFATAQSTTIGGGGGNGTMPEFIVNPLTQEQILEVRSNLGVVDDVTAHESIQQLVFGQASDSLDVLRLDRDALGNLLGTATAADGRIVPASVARLDTRSLTAQEQADLSAPLVTQFGYSFIRLTGQSGDVYTWAMTYERDGELLVIPVAWLSSSSKAEEVFTRMVAQSCETCVWLCNMDETAQLKYDMAANFRDGADFRAKVIGIGVGVLCLGAAVPACIGAFVFPPIGGPLCGAAVICGAGSIGCWAISNVVNSSRLSDYYNCLCLESQGRANGITGVTCPNPEFNDCVPGT